LQVAGALDDGVNFKLVAVITPALNPLELSLATMVPAVLFAVAVVAVFDTFPAVVIVAR
jgi:hypothetical protein